jgi:hypothetical protein
MGCDLTEGEAAAEPLTVEAAPQVDSVVLPHPEEEGVPAWVSEVLGYKSALGTGAGSPQGSGARGVSPFVAGDAGAPLRV